MPISTNPEWPVLASYPQKRLRAIGMPLGGIGTGCVSLGGRGQLRDWEIVNRPAKGFVPRITDRGGGGTFFAIWLKSGDGDSVTLALEGAIDPVDYEGSRGSLIPNHGLPRWRECSFHAAYPLGQVCLSDPQIPASVRIEAFNPLIPGDTPASSIPFALLRFVVQNEGSQPLRASICGSLENFIGSDGHYGTAGRNRNEHRCRDGLEGLFMTSESVDKGSEQWGTMTLATPDDCASVREAWPDLTWGDSLLDFWDDFSADGVLSAAPEKGGLPIASLAVPLEIEPGQQASVTYILAWHFPNRLTWDDHRNCGPGGDRCEPPGSSQSAECCSGGDCSAQPTGNPDWIGNHYATCYPDAWEAAASAAANLADLEKRTLGFVRAFTGTDLSVAVKEAALFNLSTLKTQTCFRTPDGYFYGWEGCHDDAGCCPGSCTHVWNYEQSLPYLFSDLARGMREVEFEHALDDSGRMSFRVLLPLKDRAQEWPTAAADGQLGCILKVFREWRLSDDDQFLRRLWPPTRRALEFCWIPGGWDGDGDGVMEGCQHNTMDVEYYGPNPQMQAWYLGALRAAEEMANHLGESEFARHCRKLFDYGSRWMDAELFNGEYYEHRIVPIANPDDIAAGLRHEWMGAQDLADPELQLGAGCLVDQLAGQFFAHLNGLGYLLNPENVAATHRAIKKHNFKRGFHHHFNHMRSYVLGGESGLLMATYPRGGRPKRPFPYCNEVMTGFEYTAAVGMILEGQFDEGLECIEAVRARYDGLSRNPFNEAECGHHYARAMAAWGAVIALFGYDYSAVERRMSLAAREQYAFWSTGSAFGQARIRQDDALWRVELTCVQGELELSSFDLPGAGETAFPSGLTVRPGEPAVFTV